MKSKSLIIRILVGLLMVFTGVLAISHNASLIKFAVIICGAYMLCYSLYSLFSISGYSALFQSSPGVKTLEMANSIIGIILGLFAIIAPLAWLKSVGLVMAYLIAAFLLFSAFVNARMLVGLRRLKITAHGLLVELLCDLIFALVLILAPQEVGKTIISVMGICLTAVGALIVFLSIATRVRESRSKASGAEFEELN
ncbi:MAG: DUF308 domain-containing protein [Sphaerochaetaceae bacterium]